MLYPCSFMPARYGVSYTVTDAQKLHTVQDEISIHLFFITSSCVCNCRPVPQCHYVAKVQIQKCTNSLGILNKVNHLIHMYDYHIYGGLSMGFSVILCSAWFSVLYYSPGSVCSLKSSQTVTYSTNPLTNEFLVGVCKLYTIGTFAKSYCNFTTIKKYQVAYLTFKGTE